MTIPDVEGQPARPLGRRLRLGTAIAIESDERSWRLPRRHAIAVALAPLVGGALLVLTMPSFRLFRWLTAEDSLIELLQTVVALGALVLFALIAVAAFRRRQHLFAVVYALATLAAVFVVGEENSWGQFIFDWETSGWFQRNNYQGETNLHTTGLAHGPTVYGFMALAAYGTVVPFLAMRTRWATSRSPWRLLLVPPVATVPAFFIPAAYRLIRTYVEPQDFVPRYTFQIVKFSEYAELTLYFGVFVVALLTWRFWRARTPRA